MANKEAHIGAVVKTRHTWLSLFLFSHRGVVNHSLGFNPLLAPFRLDASQTFVNIKGVVGDHSSVLNSHVNVNLGHKVRVILWTVQLSVIPPRDPTYAIIRISYM